MDKVITLKSIYDLKSLDKQTIKSAIKDVKPEQGLCHQNAGRTMFFMVDDKKLDVKYCEGYIKNTTGHCFNSINGEYFDINLKKGETRQVNLIKEVDYTEWWNDVLKHWGTWTFNYVEQFNYYVL